MILEEQFTSIGVPDEFRSFVRDAEKRHNVKINYIVGTRDNVSEEEVYRLLPIIEPELRKRNMKFAATGIIIPRTVKVEMINVLFAEYLDEDNALMNFLIKQKKYFLTKVYIIN